MVHELRQRMKIDFMKIIISLVKKTLAQFSILYAKTADLEKRTFSLLL